MAQCTWDPAKHGGQPCPVHGSGGNENNISNRTKVGTKDGKKGRVFNLRGDEADVEYEDKTRGSHKLSDLEAYDEDDVNDEFDGIEDEDFGISNNEFDDARPNHTKLNDMNLSDSDKWNMAYKYIGTDKLEKLAEELDLDSPQDIPTSELLKYMSDDEIADMIRVNGLDDGEEDFDKNPYTSPDDSDFRKGYKNQAKMSEEEFKSQFDRYGKGKAGYDYYSYGKNKGYVLSDEEGTTIGFYDLNNGTFYYEDSATEKMKSDKDDLSDVENNQYQSPHKFEDFEDARYYPVSDEDRKAAGPKWLGKYHSIMDAHGGTDENFKDKFKFAGKSEKLRGADIYQGPDGYFSGNPRINSMSFKTKEALEDYFDKMYSDYRITEPGNNYAPDAYKAARMKSPEYKSKAFNNSIGKFIEGNGSDQELDEAINSLRNQGYSDDEIIRKILMMFKGTIK